MSTKKVRHWDVFDHNVFLETFTCEAGLDSGYVRRHIIKMRNYPDSVIIRENRRNDSNSTRW